MNSSRQGWKDPSEGPQSNCGIARLPLPQQNQSACTPGNKAATPASLDPATKQSLVGGSPHGKRCGWCFPKLKGQGHPKGCYGVSVSRRWDRCLRASKKSEKNYSRVLCQLDSFPHPTPPLSFPILVLRQEARPGPSLPFYFGRTALIWVHS